MKFSTYPISLGMLNLRLDSCQSLQHISANFAFSKNDNEELTFSIFIKSIKYLIISYKDLTFQSWAEFKKNITRVFPSEHNCKAFKNLEDEVTLEFYKIYPHLFKKIENKKPDSLPFKKFIDCIEISPKNRLNLAFQIENAESPLEKQCILSQILDFLKIETDAIAYISRYLKALIELAELRKFLREGCDRVLRISKERELTLYEIPAKIEETDEFFFWIQMSSHIELSYDGDKLFASLKFHIENKDSQEELEKHLEEIKKSTLNEKIHFLINKSLTCFKYLKMGTSPKGCVSALIKFLSHVLEYYSENKISHQLEGITAPCGHHLLVSIDQHLKGLKVSKPIEDLIEELYDVKKLIQLRELEKSFQFKYFDFVFKQLKILEKENPSFNKTSIPFEIGLLEQLDKSYDSFKINSKLSSILTNSFVDNSAKTGSTISSSTAMPVSIPKKSNKKKVQKVDRKKKCATSNKARENFKAIHIQEKVDLDVEIKENQNSILDIKEEAKNDVNLCLPSSNKREIHIEIIPQPNLMPGEEFPFNLNQRVKRWDDHSFGELLTEVEFPEYFDKDLVYQKLMHIFHAPHHLVDRFILSHGIQGKWLNVQKNQEDIRYMIPAEITWGKRKYRGMIVYAIDSMSQSCYHRFFTEMKDYDVLYQAVNKVFNENDFPELRNVGSLEGSSSSKPNLIDHSSVRFDSGSVIIDDHKRGVMIKLFKSFSS